MTEHWQERGFKSAHHEAEAALGAFSGQVKGFLSGAVEKVATFDTDLDTGIQKPLAEQVAFPGLSDSGVAIARKKFNVGISNIGNTIGDVRPDELPNVVGVTLERDKAAPSNLPSRCLVLIAQVGPDFKMTTQGLDDDMNAIQAPTAQGLDASQLQTDLRNDGKFKLAPRTGEERGVGIPGYTIRGVSSFSMQRAN